MAKLTPEATTEITNEAFKWIFERYHEKKSVRLDIVDARTFPSPHNKKDTLASFQVIDGLPTIQLSSKPRKVEDFIRDLFQAFYHALDYLNNPSVSLRPLPSNHPLEASHVQQAHEDWDAFQAQRKVRRQP